MRIYQESLLRIRPHVTKQVFLLINPEYKPQGFKTKKLSTIVVICVIKKNIYLVINNNSLWKITKKDFSLRNNKTFIIQNAFRME